MGGNPEVVGADQFTCRLQIPKDRPVGPGDLLAEGQQFQFVVGKLHKGVVRVREARQELASRHH